MSDTTKKPAGSSLFLPLIMLTFAWMYLGTVLWPQPKQALPEPAPVTPPPGGVVNPNASKPFEFPPTPTESLVLGSASPDAPYFIEASFDTRGAVVRKLVLNRFGGADALGRTTHAPLELIPETPVNSAADFHPGSFELTHYVGESSKQPLDDLIRRQWQSRRETARQSDGRESSLMIFTTEVRGVRVTKTFRLTEGDYHLGLDITLEKIDPAVKSFRYQLSGPRGLPIEGDWYTQTFRNAVFGVVDNRSVFDRQVIDMRGTLMVSQGSSPAIQKDLTPATLLRYAGIQTQYFASVVALKDPEAVKFRNCQATVETAQLRGKVESCDPVAGSLVLRPEGRPTVTFKLTKDLISRWTGAPERGADMAVTYIWSPEAAEDTFEWVAIDMVPGDSTHPAFVTDATVRLGTTEIPLEDGPVTHKYVLYNGPAKPGLLSQMRGNSAVDTGVIAAYSDLKLDTLVDYPSPFGAWFLCGGFSKVVILCTNFLHGVLGYIHLVFPYGLAIIVLTVLIRLMLFPLTRGQAISSMRMQALAPELKEMQAKYGNDRQKMAQAQMELYRKNGINPLAGCLPMLLQMPIMMGLYFALQESVFFRLAPVGMTWIHNLAAPDMLLEWGDKIPWISRPSDYGGFIYLGPYLNLLPLFAMGLMVVQQKMFMPPPTSDEQKQQQDMMMVMSVIMSVMFYRVPSGLCLYFIVSSLWGLAERRLLPKSQPLASIVVKAANKPAKTEKKPGQESIIERFQRFIREAGENPRT